MPAERTPSGSGPSGQDPSQTGGETVSGAPHDLIQYPENRGLIPLAESYDLNGTEIVWEENPFTRTTTQAQPTERRALILTDDGNLHYLRGDTLYDFGHTQRSGRVQERRWTSRTPMPDVTIGEPAPFNGGARVDRVLVAAGEVTAGDPRSANLLNSAAREDTNPFDALDKAVNDLRVQHARAAARRQSRVDLTGLAVADDTETDHFPNTFRFRDSRLHHMTDETRNRNLFPDDVDAGVTSTPPGTPEAAAEARNRRLTSREGVPISPPAYGPSGYEPRIIDEATQRVGDSIRESAVVAGASDAIRGVRDRLRRDRSRPRRKL